MSDQVTKHDIKAIKDELFALRQHMSNLFLADSVHSMSVKSEKVEEMDEAAANSDSGVSDNKKKDNKNEAQSVWDVDDTMSESIREQNNSDETSNKVLRLETMVKSMMVQVKQDKSQLRDLTADFKLLEANLRTSESNAKLLEYKLKASEEKVNQLEKELGQEKDKFDDLATEQSNYRQKTESQIGKLNEKLINLEKGHSQNMKQRDEDAEMTKSEMEEIKKQMKLINMATSKRIAGVYNCLTMTKEQLDKGMKI